MPLPCFWGCLWQAELSSWFFWVVMLFPFFESVCTLSVSPLMTWWENKWSVHSSRFTMKAAFFCLQRVPSSHVQQRRSVVQSICGENIHNIKCPWSPVISERFCLTTSDFVCCLISLFCELQGQKCADYCWVLVQRSPLISWPGCSSRNTFTCVSPISCAFRRSCREAWLLTIMFCTKSTI